MWGPLLGRPSAQLIICPVGATEPPIPVDVIVWMIRYPRTYFGSRR